MQTEPSKRSTRVAQLIQEELSRLLVNGLKDPRVGFVTVTEVRISPDLQNARIFVSIYGDERTQTQTLLGLKAATGYLKRELAVHLKLRYTPDLSFSLDESLEHANRVENMLNAIAAGKTEAPNPSEQEPMIVDTPRAALAKAFAAEKATRKPKKKRPVFKRDE